MRLPSHYLWSLLSQLFSSATNFALAIAAGRALGPDGLGVVSVAFGAFLLLLGLHRALISDPLVTSTSDLDPPLRREATAAAATLAATGTAAVAVVFAVAGWAIPGAIGRGLVLVAPWLVPATVQDLWRAVLFRDSRPAAAAVNDALWLAVMLICLPVALNLDSDWAIVSAWGVGGLVATLTGFVQSKTMPRSLAASWQWWTDRAWGFGRWLAMESVLYGIGAYATIVVLAAVIGTDGLGGVRSVQSLFAPLSLVAQAIALPGLPAMARERSRDRNRAAALAWRLGGAAVGLVALYVAVAAPLASDVLRFVYGPEFARFDDLAWAVGVGQLFAAASIGFTLLLKVERRGVDLVAARATTSFLLIVLVAVLAAGYDATGAVWGEAIALTVSSLMIAALAMKRRVAEISP